LWSAVDEVGRRDVDGSAVGRGHIGFQLEWSLG
jgi:hypothetical protein